MSELDQARRIVELEKQLAERTAELDHVASMVPTHISGERVGDRVGNLLEQLREQIRLDGSLARLRRESMAECDLAKMLLGLSELPATRPKYAPDGYAVELDRVADILNNCDVGGAGTVSQTLEQLLPELSKIAMGLGDRLARAKELLDSIINDQWMWTERDVGPVRKARAELDQ